jgi:hypothetical protein
MCHWIREPDRRGDTASDVTPTGIRKLTGRMAGAIAAALVAVVATAALLMPSPTPAVSSEKAGAPVAASTSEVPVSSGVVIEQTSTVLDDGVPSSAVDVRSTKASAGHCDHSL